MSATAPHAVVELDGVGGVPNGGDYDTSGIFNYEQQDPFSRRVWAMFLAAAPAADPSSPETRLAAAMLRLAVYGESLIVNPTVPFPSPSPSPSRGTTSSAGGEGNGGDVVGIAASLEAAVAAPSSTLAASTATPLPPLISSIMSDILTAYAAALTHLKAAVQSVVSTPLPRLQTSPHAQLQPLQHHHQQEGGSIGMGHVALGLAAEAAALLQLAEECEHQQFQLATSTTAISGRLPSPPLPQRSEVPSPTDAAPTAAVSLAAVETALGTLSSTVAAMRATRDTYAHRATLLRATRRRRFAVALAAAVMAEAAVEQQQQRRREGGVSAQHLRAVKQAQSACSAAVAALQAAPAASTSTPAAANNGGNEGGGVPAGAQLHVYARAVQTALTGGSDSNSSSGGLPSAATSPLDQRIVVLTSALHALVSLVLLPRQSAPPSPQRQQQPQQRQRRLGNDAAPLPVAQHSSVASAGAVPPPPPPPFISMVPPSVAPSVSAAPASPSPIVPVLPFSRAARGSSKRLSSPPRPPSSPSSASIFASLAPEQPGESGAFSSSTYSSSSSSRADAAAALAYGGEHRSGSSPSPSRGRSQSMRSMVPISSTAAIDQVRLPSHSMRNLRFAADIEGKADDEVVAVAAARKDASSASMVDSAATSSSSTLSVSAVDTVPAACGTEADGNGDGFDTGDGSSYSHSSATTGREFSISPTLLGAMNAPQPTATEAAAPVPTALSTEPVLLTDVVKAAGEVTGISVSVGDDGAVAAEPSPPTTQIPIPGSGNTSSSGITNGGISRDGSCNGGSSDTATNHSTSSPTPIPPPLSRQSLLAPLEQPPTFSSRAGSGAAVPILRSAVSAASQFATSASPSSTTRLFRSASTSIMVGYRSSVTSPPPPSAQPAADAAPTTVQAHIADMSIAGHSESPASTASSSSSPVLPQRNRLHRSESAAALPVIRAPRGSSSSSSGDSVGSTTTTSPSGRNRASCSASSGVAGGGGSGYSRPRSGSSREGRSPGRGGTWATAATDRNAPAPAATSTLLPGKAPHSSGPPSTPLRSSGASATPAPRTSSGGGGGVVTGGKAGADRLEQPPPPLPHPLRSLSDDMAAGDTGRREHSDSTRRYSNGSLLAGTGGGGSGAVGAIEPPEVLPSARSVGASATSSSSATTVAATPTSSSALPLLRGSSSSSDGLLLAMLLQQPQQQGDFNGRAGAGGSTPRSHANSRLSIGGRCSSDLPPSQSGGVASTLQRAASARLSAPPLQQIAPASSSRQQQQQPPTQRFVVRTGDKQHLHRSTPSPGAVNDGSASGMKASTDLHSRGGSSRHSLLPKSATERRSPPPSASATASASSSKRLSSVKIAAQPPEAPPTTSLSAAAAAAAAAAANTAGVRRRPFGGFLRVPQPPPPISLFAAERNSSSIHGPGSASPHSRRVDSGSPAAPAGGASDGVEGAAKSVAVTRVSRETINRLASPRSPEQWCKELDSVAASELEEALEGGSPQQRAREWPSHLRSYE